MRVNVYILIQQYKNRKYYDHVNVLATVQTSTNKRRLLIIAAFSVYRGSIIILTAGVHYFHEERINLEELILTITAIRNFYCSRVYCIGNQWMP